MDLPPMDDSDDEYNEYEEEEEVTKEEDGDGVTHEALPPEPTTATTDTREQEEAQSMLESLTGNHTMSLADQLSSLQLSSDDDDDITNEASHTVKDTAARSSNDKGEEAEEGAGVDLEQVLRNNNKKMAMADSTPAGEDVVITSSSKDAAMQMSAQLLDAWVCVFVV